MAEFLTTNGISHKIDELILNAKKEIILVSPYLQLSQTLFERLDEATAKGVTLIIIYGRDELKPAEATLIKKLKNLTLYFSHNLHAKCYFNESEMVITSMNMYEYSARNNREMGIYLTLKEDYNLFEKAKTETNSIIHSATKDFSYKTNIQPQSLQNNKQTSLPPKQKRSSPKTGHCIRCEEKISHNTERPYCWSCFSIWSIYEDPTYAEQVCHSCGNYEQTSMIKPQCYKCFKNLNLF